MCKGCEKGHFLPFLTPFIHFWQNYFFLNSSCSKVLNETILDFSLKHAHIFLPILILDCKVFKLEWETPYFEGELVPKT